MISSSLQTPPSLFHPRLLTGPQNSSCLPEARPLHIWLLHTFQFHFYFSLNSSHAQTLSNIGKLLSRDLHTSVALDMLSLSLKCPCQLYILGRLLRLITSIPVVQSPPTPPSLGWEFLLCSPATYKTLLYLLSHCTIISSLLNISTTRP